jgi:hypothetical protein
MLESLVFSRCGKSAIKRSNFSNREDIALSPDRMMSLGTITSK